MSLRPTLLEFMHECVMKVGSDANYHFFRRFLGLNKLVAIRLEIETFDKTMKIPKADSTIRSSLKLACNTMPTSPLPKVVTATDNSALRGNLNVLQLETRSFRFLFPSFRAGRS